MYGPLIENFKCNEKFFTAVEVTAGNRLDCLFVCLPVRSSHSFFSRLCVWLPYVCLFDCMAGLLTLFVFLTVCLCIYFKTTSTWLIATSRFSSKILN